MAGFNNFANGLSQRYWRDFIDAETLRVTKPGDSQGDRSAAPDLGSALQMRFAKLAELRARG